MIIVNKIASDGRCAVVPLFVLYAGQLKVTHKCQLFFILYVEVNSPIDFVHTSFVLICFKLIISSSLMIMYHAYDDDSVIICNHVKNSNWGLLSFWAFKTHFHKT